ncbi:hypothetical protein [Candidatus Poriferisodalis sp.]|uniref:hypothetical protein n=1 Tax=Candidatus Poriferisodalis sp. TaxID=3101277 RepID=UPI003B0164BC
MILASLSLISCARAPGESQSCQAAALQQTLAEQAYGTAVESHEAAHDSGVDHSDDEIFDARVAMILAGAETRHQCG